MSIGVAAAPPVRLTDLARKICEAWALVRLVTGLLAETTTTTSACAAAMGSSAARPMSRKELRSFIVRSSEYEVDGGRQQVVAATAAEARLQVGQAAVRSCVCVDVGGFQLQSEVLAEVPARAHGDAGARGVAACEDRVDDADGIARAEAQRTVDLHLAERDVGRERSDAVARARIHV